MTDTHAEETIHLSGLEAEVTSRSDAWGIRHISASSSHDVFFAQGYFAAVDRMFQLDWWRRRGLGQTAEVLGSAYVERDRAARLFVYRGDMDEEWRSYGPRAREAVVAFVAGINAHIDATQQDPALLPAEFALLGHTPGRWYPEDVVRLRSHGIFGNIEQEVARAETLRRFGPAVEDLRKVREPEIALTVPDGLDLDCITAEVLTTYRLAKGPVLPVPPVPRVSDTVPEGSNNWALAPSRTATGRPILASDPHRAMTLPALRHVVHLTCPDFDVIGAGEPALPGVSIGHNATVAFGLTIFFADQEDLYVYDVDPDDPERYWHRGEWVRMRTVHEVIDVAGEAPEKVQLRFTVHGPVIHVDTQRAKAYAVRAAWLEPGMAPYLASLGYLDATDVEEFREALDRWGAPGSNQVAADTAGHISWTPRALVPIRPNWDGLLPVPGDGRFEWAGFREASELPSVVDPASGWVATANEMNLPTDDSWEPVPISHEWLARFRADRIGEVLDAGHAHTVADSADLQNDYVSVVAGRVLDLLPTRLDGDADAGWACELLHGWDRRMDADSVGAGLFEAWSFGELRRELYQTVLDTLVADDDVPAALRLLIPDVPAHRDSVLDLALLERLTADDVAGLYQRTLGDTVRRLTRDLGADRSSWKHGRVLVSRLSHPLVGIIDDPPAWMQLGPDPKSGSFQTVGVATYDPATGIQNGGASFRMVIDVGSWDDSIVINTPGQSGDPRSPHFDDLYGTWLADQYVPLVYSPEAVARNTATITRLRPHGPAPAQHRP